MSEIGRNDPCHCGSGKKYKKCHLEKDESEDRKKREKAALNAAKVAAAQASEEQVPEKSKKGPQPTHQGGWVNKIAGKVGFFRNLAQRRMPPANKGG